jgi:hypothetical protein
MAEIAGFMADYVFRGQHTPDRACTRYKYDLPKMIENNEITTGPGRYALGAPNAYGNAVYVPNPTIRMQKWGASHDMSSTKTDVESDLLNLGRPTTRSVCGQYAPTQRKLTPMPEEEFPRTYERLVDPPCTLRATGVNRWEWLCQNPQENVMIPFEWGVNTNLSQRDVYYGKVSQPLAASQTARDHQFLCSTMFVEPAVPVARPQPAGAPKNFSNAIPGQSQRPVEMPEGVRVASSAEKWPEAPSQAANPTAPLPYPSQNVVETQWRQTGILAPPPPFTAFIAPH